MWAWEQVKCLSKCAFEPVPYFKCNCLPFLTTGNKSNKNFHSLHRRCVHLQKWNCCIEIRRSVLSLASMAHTTSVYYRDRLGFEPETEGRRQYSQQQTTQTKSQYMSSTAVASSTTAYSSSHIGNGNGNGSALGEESSYQQHHHSRHQKSITDGSTHGSAHGRSAPAGAPPGSAASQGMYEENLNKFKGGFLNLTFLAYKIRMKFSSFWYRANKITLCFS